MFLSGPQGTQELTEYPIAQALDQRPGPGRRQILAKWHAQHLAVSGGQLALPIEQRHSVEADPLGIHPLTLHIMKYQRYAITHQLLRIAGAHAEMVEVALVTRLRPGHPLGTGGDQAL